MIGNLSASRPPHPICSLQGVTASVVDHDKVCSGWAIALLGLSSYRQMKGLTNTRPRISRADAERCEIPAPCRISFTRLDVALIYMFICFFFLLLFHSDVYWRLHNNAFTFWYSSSSNSLSPLLEIRSSFYCWLLALAQQLLCFSSHRGNQGPWDYPGLKAYLVLK